jgi:hypothetical protein
MRGQTAFETLLLLVVILSAAIIISSYYLPIHEETLAISAARSETLRQIGQSEKNIIIENISISKINGNFEIKITLQPKTILDIIKIREAVENNTSIENPIITLN